MDWDALVAHLRRDGVIAHPTETVYGFAAAVTEGGVGALRSVKPRGPDRPFLLLLPPGRAGDAWRKRLEWTPSARTLAERFWPGPVTLILRDRRGGLPAGVVNRRGGVAVRVSPDPSTTELLDRWGAPILSTSANAPGEPPARSADELRDRWAEEIRTGTLRVMDGGTLPERSPSTVVDCTGPRPTVVREGAIPTHELNLMNGVPNEP